MNVRKIIDELIEDGERAILSCEQGKGMLGTYFKGEIYEIWISKCTLIVEKYYKDTELHKRFIEASEHAVGNGKEYYDTMMGVLKAISKTEEMGIGIQSINEKKKKKIFVSHSSKNRNITDKFVELLKIIGVKNEQIYYSSYEETGVNFLQNCFERITQEFNQNELLVIFMISREFYNSKVCIAETGATWVTSDNKYIPIIIPPYSYNNIEGVISATQAAITLGDSNTNTKIEHLKSKIEKFIGVQELVNSTEWTRKKDEFIRYIGEVANELKKIDANLLDVLLEKIDMKIEAMVKIKLVNNTKHRMKLEEVNIYLKIEGQDIKKIKLNNVSVKTLAIQPFEEITVYLPVDMEQDIQKSKIRLDDSKVQLSFYQEN